MRVLLAVAALAVAAAGAAYWYVEQQRISSPAEARQLAESVLAELDEAVTEPNRSLRSQVLSATEEADAIVVITEHQLTTADTPLPPLLLAHRIRSKLLETRVRTVIADSDLLTRLRSAGSDEQPLIIDTVVDPRAARAKLVLKKTQLRTANGGILFAPMIGHWRQAHDGQISGDFKSGPIAISGARHVVPAARANEAAVLEQTLHMLSLSGDAEGAAAAQAKIDALKVEQPLLLVIGGSRAEASGQRGESGFPATGRFRLEMDGSRFRAGDGLDTAEIAGMTLDASTVVDGAALDSAFNARVSGISTRRNGKAQGYRELTLDMRAEDFPPALSAASGTGANATLTPQQLLSALATVEKPVSMTFELAARRDAEAAAMALAATYTPPAGGLAADAEALSLLPLVDADFTLAAPRGSIDDAITASLQPMLGMGLIQEDGQGGLRARAELRAGKLSVNGSEPTDLMQMLAVLMMAGAAQQGGAP